MIKLFYKIKIKDRKTSFICYKSYHLLVGSIFLVSLHVHSAYGSFIFYFCLSRGLQTFLTYRYVLCIIFIIIHHQ